MKALVDTHALLWYFGGNSKLSETALSFMQDRANVLLVSPATLWEISIKDTPWETHPPSPIRRSISESSGCRRHPAFAHPCAAPATPPRTAQTPPRSVRPTAHRTSGGGKHPAHLVRFGVRCVWGEIAVVTLEKGDTACPPLCSAQSREPVWEKAETLAGVAWRAKTVLALPRRAATFLP